MTRTSLSRGLALACLASVGLAPAAASAQLLRSEQALLPGVDLAANARNPYGNVDRRDDAGNDTGDDQVERLNEGQLDRNYRGPYVPMPPRYTGPPPQAYQGAPPQIYGAPPPGAGGPPMIYAPPPPAGYYRPPGY